MKHFVQIYLSFIIIFSFGCDGKENSSPTVQDDELVEVYVQISLIKDSDLGNSDKEILIDKYLSDKNLTIEKIDTRLEAYRADPADWRGFFMKVQSRLRELQREYREKTIDELEAMETKIVDTVITHPVKLIGNIDSNTVIRSTDFLKGETSLTQKVTDSSITVEQDTTIAESRPSINYPDLSYSSDELGLFSYEVQPGDNLSTLAGSYDTETEQLVIINSIVNANFIRIGQRLLIPNRATNIIVHTIASGEALSKISKRYNSDLEQIVRINKIDNMDAINTGDVLYVPVKKTGSEGDE